MSIDTNYATLKTALRFSNPGWAVEFGVYSGYSMHLISEKHPVIGFDSFDGLPEDWRPGFPKGKFAGRLPMLPAYGHNVMIQKGWFDDTVAGFPFPELALVHIDCDLYSSTVTALEGVAAYLYSGSVIVFDEFHGYEGHEQHEMKAWREFCDKHDVIASEIARGPEEIAFMIDAVNP